MKLSVRIAAAKRALKRMAEDQPLFMKRIESYTDSQKDFTIRFFDRNLNEAKRDLARLLAEEASLPK